MIILPSLGKVRLNSPAGVIDVFLSEKNQMGTDIRLTIKNFSKRTIQLKIAILEFLIDLKFVLQECSP